MNLTAEDKVRLLRDLTRGADDVFAVRTDRSWRPVYTSLPDSHIALHLGNTIEIGSYALIPFGNGKPPLVRWVAADFAAVATVPARGLKVLASAGSGA